MPPYPVVKVAHFIKASTLPLRRDLPLEERLKDLYLGYRYKLLGWCRDIVRLDGLLGDGGLLGAGGLLDAGGLGAGGLAAVHYGAKGWQKLAETHPGTNATRPVRWQESQLIRCDQSVLLPVQGHTCC